MVSGASSVFLTAGLHASFFEEIGTVAIVFGDEIEILVAAAGEVDQHRSGDAASCDADRMRESV